MKFRWLRDQRGSILLFTTILVVPLMIIFGGLAMDLAYFGAVRAELQRAMDAAALAGAGNLGFDSSAFPTVRAAAQQYGASNPYKNGPISLNLNTGNAPNGDIVLGVWNASLFTPSLDGTQVNAVQCRYSTPIPTSFLRLLGINTLPSGAQSIAIANPPLNSPDACVFPLGISACPYSSDPGGNAPYSSLLCGTAASFLDKPGAPGSCLTPGCQNLAAWVNLGGGPINSTYLNNTITAVAANSCTGNIRGQGEQIPTFTDTSQTPTVFSTLADAFVQNYPTATYDVKNSSGTTVYSGYGWRVRVPVLGTQCSPTVISPGSTTIAGWTYLVITQVSNGTTCFTSGAPCTLPPGVRGILGYFDCQRLWENADPNPGPRTALARRLKLVQ